LGRMSRETGHNLETVPPAKMTGKIMNTFISCDH
jgi:hypothetical protein